MKAGCYTLILNTMRKGQASNLVFHELVWIGVVLFWTVYSYSNNQNFELSLVFALSDTAHYLVSFYIISLWLLPQFLPRKKILLFSLGFLALIMVICGSRMMCYRMINTYFERPFQTGLGAVFYTFTTTLLILAAASSIKLAIDWLQSQKDIEQIEKERAKAELNFLKGQLNPHFLFNSINTLYGNIDSANEVARAILLKLSDMLRYQLYECGTDIIEIEKEIEYIKNYVALQRLRANSNLNIDLFIAHEVKSIAIPPLLLSPFIENAFKHVSKFKEKQNWIKIALGLEKQRFNFNITNSLDIPNDTESHLAGGIGVANIKRRLELIYGKTYDLNIEKTDETFSVNLSLDLS